MQASDLYRWSGIAGIAAGVLNVLVEFVPQAIGQPLDLLANTIGLWVLTALYLRQREASGALGFTGYILKSFGLALVIGFLFAEAFVLSGMEAEQRAAVLAGPTGLATVTGLAIVTLGAIVFGIATVRAGVFPKWAALLLAIGFVMAPIGAALPIVMTPGQLILSIGLIGLSYVLFSGAKQAN